MTVDSAPLPAITARQLRDLCALAQIDRRTARACYAGERVARASHAAIADAADELGAPAPPPYQPDPRIGSRHAYGVPAYVPAHRRRRPEAP